MIAPAFLRSVVVAAGLLAAGLLAAGCSTSGHPGALGNSASRLSGSASESPEGQNLAEPAPATAAPSPSAGPVSGSSGPAAEPAAAGPGRCPASDLKVSLGASNGAAGSIYYPLDFTNSGDVTCTMYGYPGVAFASAPGGTVIGVPAIRNSTFPAELVTLPAGATAHASLQVQVAQSYPASLCKPVTAHWLQVYPPGSYTARDVAFTAVTCTGKIPSRSTLGIYVVRSGATGP